jgi:hypothetical protein
LRQCCVGAGPQHVAAGASAHKQQRGATLDPPRLSQCGFVGATTATSASGCSVCDGDRGAGKLRGRAHGMVARGACAAWRCLHKLVHASVGARGVAVVFAPRRRALLFFHLLQPSASSRPGPWWCLCGAESLWCREFACARRLGACVEEAGGRSEAARQRARVLYAVHVLCAVQRR